MWDYYYGGTHNYEIDRKAAEDASRRFPALPNVAIENRKFLHKSVRWLVRQGITQFIDIGCGLPTEGSTHETILELEPNAKILYIDIEESAVEDGNVYIRETGWEKQVTMIQASGLEPEAICAHPETRRIIDFEKPVAVMMFALIHFFSDSQYKTVLDFWRNKVAKGSAFVMTHVTEDDRNEVELKEVQGLKDVYDQTPTPLIFRSQKELEPVMDGWDIVKPGIVRPHLWKNEEGLDDGGEWPLTRAWWVGVGFKR